MQRGIHVGAADRLDEGAHHIVVLVTIAVVTHRGAVHRLLHHLHGYDGARPSSCFKGDLQGGQRSPRVTGGELHQQAQRFRVHCYGPAEPTFIGDSPGEHLTNIVVGQRLQLQDQ